MYEILSYFREEDIHPAAKLSSSSDFLDLLRSLQCGDSLMSIIPSIIYLIGIALLVHHIITMNIRPQLYRRVGRELLLQVPWQEILILMLIYQCIRIWLSTLVLVNSLFGYYQKQLIAAYSWDVRDNENDTWGPFSFLTAVRIMKDFMKFPFIILYVISGFAPFERWMNVKDIHNFHPIVKNLLRPRLMKILLCTCMSIIPFLALIKLKERRSLPQFMLWMGPVRRDRTELGASVYYLERPISNDVTPNSSDLDLKRFNSAGDVNGIRIIKKKFRTRKSVSV